MPAETGPFRIGLDRIGSNWIWSAGEGGTAAAGLLRPGGALLLVHSALCGVPATLERLGRAGLPAGVTDRRSVPFGLVPASRRRWSLDRGLIAPGADTEELVIIRAERVG